MSWCKLIIYTNNPSATIKFLYPGGREGWVGGCVCVCVCGGGGGGEGAGSAQASILYTCIKL